MKKEFFIGWSGDRSKCVANESKRMNSNFDSKYQTVGIYKRYIGN